MDTVAYLVSDLHLGPGRDPATGAWHPLEDFQVDDGFCAFLDHISVGGAPVELVIAGDFIDFPQILPELGLTSPANQLGTTEEESLERTKVVVGQRPDVSSGHPAVFARMRRFMEDGHSITIIVGNHDVDLLWPKVWALLFDTIYPPGAAGELRRMPFSYVIGSGSRGRIYIEHGHERDPENAIGDLMAQPFTNDRFGVRRVKRPYGTLFVDKVYNQLERERWFIDNVKPISRVIGLGLKNDFAFTAPALALLIKFFFTSGLPPRQLPTAAAVLGEAGPDWPEQERTADALVDAVADTELRDHLARRMADPSFRTEFEQEVQQFNEEEWRTMAAGASYQPTLDQITTGPAAPTVLGEREDQYQAAARQVLEADASISAVVMGHTHDAIDGLVQPLYLSGGRTAYYFNSGTWTQHLRERPDYSLSWQEITDSANYTSSLTYLQFTPGADGAYSVELHNWAAELQV